MKNLFNLIRTWWVMRNYKYNDTFVNTDFDKDESTKDIVLNQDDLVFNAWLAKTDKEKLLDAFELLENRGYIIFKKSA